MASQFDELNILNTDSQEITRSMPYEEYFGEMDITDKQKEERIAIAKDFEGMALFLMALFAISGAVSQFYQEASKTSLFGRSAKAQCRL